MICSGGLFSALIHPAAGITFFFAKLCKVAKACKPVTWVYAGGKQAYSSRPPAHQLQKTRGWIKACCSGTNVCSVTKSLIDKKNDKNKKEKKNCQVWIKKKRGFIEGRFHFLVYDMNQQFIFYFSVHGPQTCRFKNSKKLKVWIYTLSKVWTPLKSMVCLYFLPQF